MKPPMTVPRCCRVRGLVGTPQPPQPSRSMCVALSVRNVALDALRQVTATRGHPGGGRITESKGGGASRLMPRSFWRKPLSRAPTPVRPISGPCTCSHALPASRRTRRANHRGPARRAAHTLLARARARRSSRASSRTARPVRTTSAVNAAASWYSTSSSTKVVEERDQCT